MKSKKTSSKQVLCAVVALFTAVTFSVHAESKSGKSIVENASNYAKTVPAFELEVALKLKITADGEASEQEVGYSIAHQRPDKFSVRIEDSEMNLSMYSDASGTTQYLKDFNQYMVSTDIVPPVELVGSMAIPQLSPAVSFVGEYANPVPFESVLKADAEIVLVGEETVNEVLSDHIRVQYKGQTIDAWFSQGAKPLLQRVIPETPELLERIKEFKQSKDVQLVVQFDIQDWTFDGDIASAVQFTPSEGMEKVDAFYKPVPAMGLRGKPAPAIKLTSMQGEPFDLADEIGKGVIVLDFWATWCGPCRTGMPILTKVIDDYKDKGVRLYTINSSDAPEQVKSFLKEMKLDVPVLMDPSYKTSEAYFAESIPLTIMIDKKGNVQKVHSGLNPNTYEAQLRAELDELIQ